MKPLYLFKFLFLSFSIAYSQNYVFEPVNNIPVTVNGNALTMPFAGGINSAQVNKMDLNNDGVEDLVIFDRHSFKISTFLASGNKFVYEPSFENYFPKIINWLVLADYNCDGKKDIFTASLGDFSSYVKIYKNIGTQFPLWKTVKDGIKSKDVNGLPVIDVIVGFTDYPAIDDIDSDGDLDILVFNGTSGIEYHKNNSIELYSNCDSLNSFEKYHSCWGKVYISGDCENILTLNQSCASGYGGTNDNQRVQHGGSNITLVDADGDGKKDILVGDILCSNLTLGFNVGTNLIGSISGVNAHFPTSHPVTVSGFPNSFFIDVDFDGNKDLLASPNLDYARNEKNEFTKSLWYYKNTGNNTLPSFNFEQDNFLQNEMIEVGENASPTLADYDLDGDLDLFIGNRGKNQNGNYIATISLYKNVGTRKEPAFVLEDSDYLSLSGLNLARIRPKFADINNDGAFDIYFYNFPNTFANSDEPKISYIFNINAGSQPFSFPPSNLSNFTLENSFGTAYYQSTSYDSPSLFDVNKDGLKDLIIGKENGSLHYLQHIGTAQSPIFKQISAKMGGFDIDFNRIFNASELANLNDADTLELVKIDQSGILKIYPIFDFNAARYVASDSNFIFNTNTSLVGISKLGSYNSLAIGDINGDTLQDIIIGTGGGGVLILKNLKNKIKNIVKDTTLTVITIPSSLNFYKKDDLNLAIFPNPNKGSFNISSAESGNISVENLLGQKFWEGEIISEKLLNVNIPLLNKGIYLIKFSNKNYFSVKKIAVE